MGTTFQTKFSLVKIGIIILTVITALIHVSMALAFSDPLFTPLFLLNGVGYIILLVGYFLPMLEKYRGTIRWLFIGYTAVTIIAYFGANAGDYSTFGLVDKAVEVLLIVLLFLDRK